MVGILLALACSDRQLGQPDGDPTSTGEPGTSGVGEVGSASADGTSLTQGSSPGTTVADGSSSEPSSDDEAGSFIPPGGDLPPDECNPEQQTGCAGGEKCVLADDDEDGWYDRGRCFPVDPQAVELYEPCAYTEGRYQGAENCSAQSLCMYTGGGDQPSCVGLCLFAEPDGWDDVSCEDPYASPSVGCQTCFCMCIPSCDPIAQDCPAAQGCYPVQDDLECAADASGEAGGAGTPCEFVNACDPGLLCADAEDLPSCESSVGCCTPFCDLEAADCPAGTECTAWFEPGDAPVGYEHVGACLSP
ncbi:MAG: hypothetical protein IAG13_23260 [Deltaproteobacteria bacterium]|nr:hypothetical protein [Nannocystaceae bacterium]